LGTLDLWVLELFAMYATDGQTDGRTDNSNAYCPFPYGRGHNNMKLVHWPSMCRLLHLVQRGGDWAEPQPAQATPRLAVPNVTAHPSAASVPTTLYCCIMVRCSAVLMWILKG